MENNKKKINKNDQKQKAQNKRNVNKNLNFFRDAETLHEGTINNLQQNII